MRAKKKSTMRYSAAAHIITKERGQLQLPMQRELQLHKSFGLKAGRRAYPDTLYVTDLETRAGDDRFDRCAADSFLGSRRTCVRFKGMAGYCFSGEIHDDLNVVFQEPRLGCQERKTGRKDKHGH